MSKEEIKQQTIDKLNKLSGGKKSGWIEDAEKRQVKQQAEIVINKYSNEIRNEFKWVEEDYPIDIWRSCFELAKKKYKDEVQSKIDLLKQLNGMYNINMSLPNAKSGHVAAIRGCININNKELNQQKEILTYLESL